MLISLLTLASAAPSGHRPASPAELETLLSGAPVLLAALLAAALTAAWTTRKRSPPPAMLRLGRGAGFRPFGDTLPGTGEGPSVWISADPARVAASLAARLAVRGPVLLLPRPSDRTGAWARFGPGHLPVWMPEDERPSARAVLAAAAALLTEGRSAAIVVTGVGALERVVGGRPAAAVEELLKASSLPVFVVVGEGEAAPAGPWPTVPVTVDADRWRAEDTPLRLHDGLLEPEAP